MTNSAHAKNNEDGLLYSILCPVTDRSQHGTARIRETDDLSWA
jgi:hypothetical protein